MVTSSCQDLITNSSPLILFPIFTLHFHVSVCPSIYLSMWNNITTLKISDICLKFDGVMHSIMKQKAIVVCCMEILNFPWQTCARSDGWHHSKSSRISDTSLQFGVLMHGIMERIVSWLCSANFYPGAINPGQQGRQDPINTLTSAFIALRSQTSSFMEVLPH